jgi:subtilisin family serine protease
VKVYRWWTRFVVVATAVGLLGQAAFSPGAMQAQQGEGQRLVRDRQRPAVEGLVSFAPGLPGGPMAQQAARLHVVVELHDPPVARAYADALAAPTTTEAQAAALAQSQLARVEAAQQQLLPALRALDAEVIYRVQRVYNGVALAVDASRLPAIRQMPEVKAIHPLTPKEISNYSSVPLVGAAEVWASAGITGTSIRIGIIDTGIDYIHTNFGGPGDEAAYAANNTEVISDEYNGLPLFPTAKVVGGFDFAGPDYDANPLSPFYDAIPKPDPDPMDCDGHGSHVAGTAAGLGVTAGGSTYEGPYDKTTPFEALRIGPGVAPGAALYALKVFGCPSGRAGSTLLTDVALEWALDPNQDGNFEDRLDVVNLSLGGVFGSDHDLTAVAANNAALAGVVVVAAAGNGGDTFYILSSPGAASRALSVASSVDSFDTLDGFLVTGANIADGVYPGSRAVGFDWDSAQLPVTGTLVYPPSQRSGCQPFTPGNAALLAGNVALLDWTHTATGTNECGSATRVGNAAAAGAVGVILAYNRPVLEISIAGTAQIPAMLTTQAVGAALKAALPMSVTFSSEYLGNTVLETPGLVDTLSRFSSRGPQQEARLKPDISAPGQSIWSTGHGTGDQGLSLNGTSMATPHVAGAMALLRAMHPDWSVERLKALAMNTALNDLRYSPMNTDTVPVTAPIYAPSRAGAGRLDLANAVGSDVAAYNLFDPGAVSVSTGLLEVLTGTTRAVTQTVQVVNAGSASISYNIEYFGVVQPPGLSVSVPGALSVPAGGQATFDVRTQAVGSQLGHAVDPTIDAMGGQRHWLTEAAGHVMLIPQNAALGAEMTGGQVVPPAATSTTGRASFSYNSATNQLAYTLTLTATAPITLQSAGLHRGIPGINGPVAHTLFSGSQVVTGSQVIASGTLPLSAGDERLLLAGDLYVSVSTSARPAGEVRGQVRAAGAPALRVPYYSVARPASDMRAASGSLAVAGPVDSQVIGLIGSGLPMRELGPPLHHPSVVTALQLQEISGSGAGPRAADLQYVGVASDLHVTGSLESAMAFFGIVTHDPWASPNTVMFDIWIDTDQNGAFDYILFNWDLGSATGGPPSDVLVTVLYHLSSGLVFLQDYVNYFAPGSFDTVLFNTNAMILPLYLGDLNLGGSPTFNYLVRSYERGLPIDVSQVHSYDPSAPGLEFQAGVAGMPAYLDLPGFGVPVGYDRARFEAQQALGVLLVHHHNALGGHAEVVRIAAASDLRLYLPVIRR